MSQLTQRDVYAFFDPRRERNMLNAIWTALMYGAFYGHIDAVKELLRFNVDTSLRNKVRI